MSNIAVKIPSLTELVAESDDAIKENALMVILNQDPPKQWLETHPTVKVKNKKGESVPLEFLPITRVEYLLSRIFTKWWVEVKDIKIIANSIVATVRVYVKNPITNEIEWNDGIGASPLQIKKDSGGAIDFQNMQTAAVQMAAPSAESYAIKDAAEKWGKLFGKDLGRKDVIDYSNLLKHQDEPATKEELIELRKQIADIEVNNGLQILSDQDNADYQRVLQNNETKTYNTIRKMLTKKLEEAKK